MSQRGENVFDYRFRQGRDRQEGIHFEFEPDDRPRFVTSLSSTDL